MFCHTTWLYDVTLSMEFSMTVSSTRGLPPSLDLSSLSINLSTPLPVATCIPVCPISVLLFTSNSTLPQYTTLIKISTRSFDNHCCWKRWLQDFVTAIHDQIGLNNCHSGIVVQHAKMACTPTYLKTSLSCDFPSCVSSADRCEFVKSSNLEYQGRNMHLIKVCPSLIIQKKNQNKLSWTVS